MFWLYSLLPLRCSPPMRRLIRVALFCGLIAVDVVMLVFSRTDYSLVHKFGSRDDFLLAVAPECLTKSAPACNDGTDIYFNISDCEHPTDASNWTCTGAVYRYCETTVFDTVGACNLTGECVKCREANCGKLKALYAPANEISLILIIIAVIALVGIVVNMKEVHDGRC
jgi:hypothetical protein